MVFLKEENRTIEEVTKGMFTVNHLLNDFLVEMIIILS